MENGTLKVAETILEQLGGRRFVVITGASRLVGSADTLSFSAFRRRYSITLDASDTYTLRQATPAGRIVAEVSGIYCDQLVETFERVSGLVARFSLRGSSAPVEVR